LSLAAAAFGPPLFLCPGSDRPADRARGRAAHARKRKSCICHPVPPLAAQPTSERLISEIDSKFSGAEIVPRLPHHVLYRRTRFSDFYRIGSAKSGSLTRSLPD